MSWDTITFSQLYDSDSRNGLTKPSKVRGSGWKMINMGELFANDRIYDIPMELVPLTEKEKESAKVEEGDLLFARQSLVLEGAGKCSIVMGVSPLTVFESHIIRVRLKHDLANPLFYYYYFRSAFSPIKTIVSQCAQAGIRGSDLQELSVVFPPIDQQNRIAGILTAYDDLIEANQRQIKLLEEAARRLYKEWFVDLRFPGHENVPVVDGVPEGWRRVSLDDVLLKISTGLNPRKNFVLGRGQNYYVTIKNMGDNDIYLDDKCDKVDDEAIQKINSRSDLQTGDILFSGIGTIGRVYLISIPTNNWNVSESVFTMRANDKITNEYLYMILLSDDLQQYCDHHAHGAAQRGIRMADLRAYRLLLPSEEVLQCFSRMAKPLIEKTQSLQKQNKFLTEGRERLLPKLMHGEIEV